MSDDLMLELDRIECAYGDLVVARNLSLRVRKKQVVCLLGPSGCGKTTVLRAIAGFEPLQGGEIRLRGKTVSRPGATAPPEQRRIGMVFQDYALFPHLNGINNVTFGLRHLSGPQRRRVGHEMLDLVGLGSIGKRFPHELSGGQQQRVALARALAGGPDLVLLDEPFSSLDVDLRERLGQEVRDILKEKGVTAVMVTHDQQEAFAMAELIGVMNDGGLLQWDTPYNLYHNPVDRFVADFIGQGRFVRATLLTPDTLQTEIGLIQADRAFLCEPGTKLDVLLRPDDIVADDGDSALRAKITGKAFKGAETLYTLTIGDNIELLSLFPSHADLALGEEVGIRIAAEHAVAFPAT